MLAIPGLPSPEKATVARPKKAAKAVEKPIETPTGENAGDIMRQWLGYLAEKTSVPVPKRDRERIAREVRGLIADGYSTAQIKFGLLCWTAEALRNPQTSPAQLPRMTWMYAVSGTPEGRRYRATMDEAMVRYGLRTNAGPAARPTARSQRQAANQESVHNWSPRRP